MEDLAFLLSQYKETLKDTHKLLERADDCYTLDDQLKSDKKIIEGIIEDLEFAILWMETGRRPGNKRGIERLAAYQRERPFDPLLMQKYFRNMDDHLYEWDNHIQEDSITSWDKERIEDALSVLSKREKEIYLMSRGQNIPYSQIAKYLGITIGTVKTNIKRAEAKISQQITESLFCVC